MTTGISSQAESPSGKHQPVRATSLDASLQPQEDDPFFLFDEVDIPDESGEPLALPFQVSAAFPSASTHKENSVAPIPTATPRSLRSRLLSMRPWLKVMFLLASLLAALSVLGLTLFAQATPPLTTGKTTSLSVTQQVGATPTRAMPTMPTPTAASGGPVGSWVPRTLPAGWTQSGLLLGDALYAERTALTFTDREMSLDYRNVGTLAQHGGTMTAATFILTPNAKVRFQQNDLRVINNVLFESVENRQLIQAVVNETPHLSGFQIQGQQLFAWVDVSFQLWQAQLDPKNQGHRSEGIEADPATNQPKVHHMSVLLLRVTPGTQGMNAPMGGTGWLVSNYALDLPGGANVDLVQPA